MRFTKPEVDRISLSDGAWIEVKHDLNTGELKKLEAAGLKPPAQVGDRVINPIDWERYELERAMIFLTDWNAKDANDKPVPLTINALRALDVESFDEINQAIAAHTMKRATEKKLEKEVREKMKPESASEAT